jgi:hypothetical protein
MTYRPGAGAPAGASVVRVALAFLAIVAFVVPAAGRAEGASVAPVLQEGATVCSDVKPQRKELRVAPPEQGTHAFDDGKLSGSYTLTDASLDWTADIPVDYVLVHGADGTSYYQYPGGTEDDTDLTAPNGGAIDAVRFCYDNQNRGTLRIVKETDPAGSAQRFAFHPSADLSPSDFDLADGESVELRPKPGTYTLTEADTPGWNVDSIVCDDADSTGSGSTATIVVDPNESIVCTFRNVREQPPVKPPAKPPVAAPVVRVAPPPPPAAAPAPRVAVKAAVAARGTARLRRPARCVSGRFALTVSGAPIRRIVFTVNGRRVKTVVARGNRRAFTVTLPAARGTVQRVAAGVTFANGAPARTLRTTMLRCAPRRVVRQFTG